MPNEYSSKSRLVTFLLSWLFGVFGAHRFYVGKTGTAVLMIFTFGGFGIWALIDMIVILCGCFRDSNDKKIYYWLEADSLRPPTKEVEV